MTFTGKGGLPTNRKITVSKDDLITWTLIFFRYESPYQSRFQPLQWLVGYINDSRGSAGCLDDNNRKLAKNAIQIRFDRYSRGILTFNTECGF